jgi:carboxypeptidase Taq
MTSVQAYSELVELSKQASTLASVSSVLGWDQETYMPMGGAEHRGNQQALLAGLIHDRQTSPRFGELLSVVENDSEHRTGDTPESANIREWRRRYDRATKLPKSLVEELARTTSLAQGEWAAARSGNDFPRFQPWLQKIVELKRQESAALSAGRVNYDALLDEYEPGATAENLARIFAELRQQLVPFLKKLLGSLQRPDVQIVRRAFDIEKQKELGRLTAEAFGFDFSKGRLDETAHPFCTGLGPGDVRLTTRFNPNYFNDGFFSILHETGHGLYEQGLLPEHFGTPMGDAVSLGIHETQSRLWENLVGRSHSFWTQWYPRTRTLFSSSLGDVPLDQFHGAINAVAPSLIRVDADEVTYNLHVMLRFELERDLLSGDLPIGDVPNAWNQRMQEYLTVTPPDDRQGCLQDVHWSFGLFGYFPTYTLGNLGAAQLFGAANRELGGLDSAFVRGEFKPLLDWLREKVHRHGMRYRPNELIQKATGSALTSEAFMRTLQEKFGRLYNV